MTGVFVFLTVLFFVLFILTVFFALRLARQLRSLESMIVDTMADMEEAAEVFNTLVNRRSLLSDDPDVRRIRQVFGVTLDILGEFIRNAKDATKRTQEEKEGRE